MSTPSTDSTTTDSKTESGGTDPIKPDVDPEPTPTPTPTPTPSPEPIPDAGDIRSTDAYKLADWT